MSRCGALFAFNFAPEFNPSGKSWWQSRPPKKISSLQPTPFPLPPCHHLPPPELCNQTRPLPHSSDYSEPESGLIWSFPRNRTRNRARWNCLSRTETRTVRLNCTETQKENKKPPQRNRRNRKPAPLEPFYPRTIPEPGHPKTCKRAHQETQLLPWLPLQSLAVKKTFFCANFGRWKTFRTVPVRNF